MFDKIAARMLIAQIVSTSSADEVGSSRIGAAAVLELLDISSQ
jgi:hypothetical protein